MNRKTDKNTSTSISEDLLISDLNFKWFLFPLTFEEDFSPASMSGKHIPGSVDIPTRRMKNTHTTESHRHIS